MTVTDISIPGLNFTRSQEGRALRAYQDTTGVWTLGYGLTNYDRGLPWRIGPGVTCTEDQAEWFLYKSLRDNYLPAVLRVLDQTRLAKPQGAVDGGLDMHYNTGGILKASWPRELNAGNMAAAKASLESWNRAGGRVLSDLVRRRAGEWLEISEENYGVLIGPAGVVVNAAGREVGERGSGGLLTAYPADPGIAQPPKVTDAASVPVATTPNPGALKPGATGDAVTDVQDKLTAAGLPTPPTGTYDATTTENVTKFQQAHPNLTADGETGPATSAALTRAGDLRAKSANVAKASIVIPTAAAALWQYVSTNAGEIALVIGGVLALALIGYVAYSYRHDASAVLNKMRGKIVP